MTDVSGNEEELRLLVDHLSVQHYPSRRWPTFALSFVLSWGVVLLASWNHEIMWTVFWTPLDHLFGPGLSIVWCGLAWPFATVALYVATQVQRPRPKIARFEISGGSLAVGRRRIPRESVVGGGYEDLANGSASVTLFLRRTGLLSTLDRLTFVVPSRDIAVSVIDAIADRAFFAEPLIVWTAPAIVFFLAVGILAMCAAMLVTEDPLLYVFSGGCAVVACALASSRVRVLVGDDGVEISSLVRRRFVPFRSVRAVASNGASLIFTLESEQTLAFRFAALRSADFVPSQPARLLASRIGIALRYFREARERRLADTAEGRTAREWLATRRVQGSSYRSASSSTAALAAVIANPSAPPDIRAVSAVVLRSEDPERAAVAIGAAVRDTANHKLRVALKRIEDGVSDEELHDHLDELVLR